ncbi:MAG: hypothetical protein CVT77_03075 [Alphaproteobacteria bacterium HGW-Alphaproteobacteria-16]|nr:MAG: hypothetical protein CVT77_03075 [Alphaproteobacteria bacterium HGW-Alphaproteobacteria-16]
MDNMPGSARLLVVAIRPLTVFAIAILLFLRLLVLLPVHIPVALLILLAAGIGILVWVTLVHGNTLLHCPRCNSKRVERQIAPQPVARFVAKQKARRTRMFDGLL